MKKDGLARRLEREELLVLLLLAAEKGQEFGATITTVSLIACALLVVVFIRIERRQPEPLIPLDLFHNRVIIVTTAHGLLAGMMLFGSMIYLPLFIQAVIGTTATQAGEVLTPYILAWTFAAIAGGRLMLRSGYRPIVIAGMLLTLAGSLSLARVDVNTTRLYLTLAVIPLVILTSALLGGLTLPFLILLCLIGLIGLVVVIRLPVVERRLPETSIEAAAEQPPGETD